MRLQNKILLPILAVLILSFAFISFMSVSFTSGTVNEIVESQMISVADSVSHQIKTSDDIVSIVLGMMDDKNIALAQALADIIAENPDNLEPQRMGELAKLFGVDEVHVTDENGVLLWGNVADFYGFDFRDGDQTLPLLAILDDSTLTIAQEPMPRSTDGVMFQYISVSRIDQKGIVQVGVSMGQIGDIKASMSAQNTIEGTHIGQNGGAFVLDSNGIVIADSAKSLIGKDLSGEGWFSAMSTGKEGRLNYDFDGIAYESYYRLADDYIIVTYIPASEIDDYANSSLLNIIIIGIAATLIVALITIFLIRWVVKKMYWYENILDSIPFPLSVTDNNRKWTFINKAVEGFLSKKRSEVMGQPCSNWGAGICNTNNCGINCLEHGKSETTFNQMGMDFKVSISYLTDAGGHRIGHVEIVQDISEMVKTHKEEAELVQEISQISQNFVSASKSISSGSQALAQGSMEQSSAIEQLSSSIAEVADKTKSNADMANKAAALAETIKGNAEKGSRQMAEMMSAVKEINDASQSINKVIKVIDDIAFQTNILALNAAVEAARAGQHGKGFAVVAEEVRNLAAKSAEAAKDTGGLIANSMEKAEMGARIADETAASLGEIVTGINDSNLLVSEIAKSSEEQSYGISQINAGIDQVAQVVQQNSATAEESASASDEMSTQAGVLEELLAQFKASEIAALPEADEPKRLN